MAPVPQELVSLLEALKSMPRKNLTEIVSHLDAKSVNLLSQLFHNVVYNTIHISPDQYKKIKRRMRKNKQDWRNVVNRKFPVKNKRGILKSQSGTGLLATIISVALPLILGLINKK